MASKASASKKDVITGSEYNDQLKGDGKSKKTVYGLGGNDSFDNFGANTTIFGGLGDDRIYSSIFDSITLNGEDGDDYLSDYWATGKKMYGGNGYDKLLVGGKDLRSYPAGLKNRSLIVDGGDGNDLIQFNAIIPLKGSVIGGLGDDIIAFGNSLSSNHSSITFDGGEGNDWFNFKVIPKAKEFSIYGGNGYDSVIIKSPVREEVYADHTRLVFAEYQTNGVTYEQIVKLYGIEKIYSSIPSVAWNDIGLHNAINY